MGRQRRWRRRGVVRRGWAVVAGLFAGVGLVGCSTDGDEASASPPPTAVAPPTTERPTAGEIAEAVVVVDSGLTEGQVISCNTAGGQATGFYPNSCPPEQREPIRDSVLYGSVSYGFVVENTSDQVIMQLPVTYRFLDIAGEVIVEHRTVFSDDDSTGDTETIPVIRPGERVGIGGMKYPGRPGAAELQIEVGEPLDWMSEAVWYEINGYGRADHGELTITELDVQAGDDNEPVTTFTVESSFEQDKRVGAVYVVFYNPDGEIIGGADDAFSVDSIPTDRAASGEVALDDPIEVPGIDPSRTAVYFPGIRVAPR
jgi:hypothetical protein